MYSFAYINSKESDSQALANIKVDRVYGCKTCCDAPIMKAMNQQIKDVKNEFNRRLIEFIYHLLFL